LRLFGLDCGRRRLDAFIQPPTAVGKPRQPRVPVRGAGIARSRGTVLLEAAGAFVLALGWAAVLVLLPPAVRGAAAVRAAPYRAG